jgi:hypothetical protein
MRIVTGTAKGLLCGALLLAGSGGVAAARAADAPAPEAGTGPQIQEFVIGVADLERSLPAFTTALKWRVFERGRADATVARLWGLPVGTRIEQALVGNANSRYGHVRLAQIDLPGRVPIRPGARWWDTGGMLNMNVLVRDLDATVAALRALGWTTNSMPSSYGREGAASGRSMIMIGPDDLVLSFQQRISPPLTGWPPFEGAGHIEIGYQVVRDLDAWYAFYTGLLGFVPSGPIRTDRNPKPIGPNIFGLPYDAVGLTDGRQANVLLRPGHEQSFGVRQFARSTGEDFAARARPPNLGITSVRVPMKDLAGLRERLRRAGAEFAADLQVVALAPYGTVRALAVRSPGGSGLWLELFEPGASPMTETELREFTRRGRFATWTRFNNELTGSVWWFPDGSARVKWDAGNLDERGTWTVRGDAVCTAWPRLRSGRELCVKHYRLAGDTTQSFRVDGGGPDGIYDWREPGRDEEGTDLFSAEGRK